MQLCAGVSRYTFLWLLLSTFLMLIHKQSPSISPQRMQLQTPSKTISNDFKCKSWLIFTIGKFGFTFLSIFLLLSLSNTDALSSGFESLVSSERLPLGPQTYGKPLMYSTLPAFPLITDTAQSKPALPIGRGKGRRSTLASVSVCVCVCVRERWIERE